MHDLTVKESERVSGGNLLLGIYGLIPEAFYAGYDFGQWLGREIEIQLQQP